MKFDICFATDEIRLVLTESLKLPEGRVPWLESPAAQAAFDQIPQIESMVRQFLDKFAEDCDGSR
ncbi:hypothetical protein MnTg02_01664 [bacterium MnTg02]|nr:hypothetical protein MnTg02_01664 [bacterium MnTg02]